MTPPPDRVSQRCVCPAAGCTAHMQTPAEVLPGRDEEPTK